MKQFGKIIRAILAATLMMLVLSPYMPVKAEDDTDGYGLWVGGVEVTEENKDDILNDGGKAKYDPDTGTLSFDDPSFASDLGSAIAAADLDLIIKGKVKAIGTTFGIYVENGTLTIAEGDVYAKGEIASYSNDLTVSGGKLTAVNVPGSQQNKVAVFAENGITVSGGNLDVTAGGARCSGLYSGGNFTLTSGTVTVNSNGSDTCYGIRSGKKINIGGGSVTVTTESSGGLLSTASALSANEVTKISDGTVNVTAVNRDYNARTVIGNAEISGGNVTVKAEGNYGYGFFDTNLTVSGGKLEVTCVGDRDSFGIRATDITVSGGELIASCDSKDGDAISGDGDVVISGGKVTATGKGEGTDAISVWLMYGSASFEISGGEVSCTATGKGTLGIFTNQALTISGGKLESKGAAYGIYSQGLMTIGNGIESVTADGSQKAIYTDNVISLGNELTIKEPVNGVLNDESNTINNSNGSVATHALIVNEKQYTITVEKSENGTVESDREKADDGEKITLTVVPDDNCKLGSISVKDAEGNEVELRKTDDGYEFTMPKSDVTVTATFIRYYSVNVPEESADFVEVSPETAPEGGKVTITLKEVQGYVIKGVTVTDGEGNVIEVGEDGTFEMPASDVTVTVEARKLFTLTFDLDGGRYKGKTTYVVEIEEGTVIKMPRPSKTGYKFAYWKGSKYYAGESYTVTGDHEFKAIWEEETDYHFQVPQTGIGS